MNEPKAFEAGMAGSTGVKGILADPLALATKPAVIFKFASSVSILSIIKCYNVIRFILTIIII